MGLLFLVNEVCTSLFLGESFAVDLGGSPESGRRPGRKGWCNSPADGWVEGVRVEPGEPAADFASLWFEVFAPPHDVFKITRRLAAIVTYDSSAIIKLGKLDFVVTPTCASYVYKGAVLIGKTLGCRPRGMIVDFQ